MKKIIFVFILLSTTSNYCQIDSLIFKGNNIITGEIKKMEKGILEISTSYDDDDFKVKWSEVKEIYTSSTYTFSINGEIYKGKIASVDDKTIKVFDKDSIYITVPLTEVVYFSQYKNGFKNRFDAEIEFGFNYAKAQNLVQFSSRNSLSYKTDKSTFSVSYNFIRSSQSNTEEVKRSDGLLTYNRLIFRRWFFASSIATLANTEQKIDLRANTQIGIGNYIYSTNKAYWGVRFGVNNNLEKFENDPDRRSSWEGVLGTELNIYDASNLDLKLVVIAYSSFTDAGRFRSDITFDIKYDLPLDFFIRTGLSYNYDNKPALNASDSDYVIRSGIGWEW